MFYPPPPKKNEGPHFGLFSELILTLAYLTARAIMSLSRAQNIFMQTAKLRERARCGEFWVLIGYPSGQDGALLPVLPVSFPQIKQFRPGKAR